VDTQRQRRPKGQSGVSNGTYGSAEVEIDKPGGCYFTTVFSCGTSCSSSLTLPTTGAYSLRLIPAGASIGSLTATATTGP